MLRRFVRTKNQPLVDKVELIEANPNFVIVKFLDGRQSTVSVRDLAPSPTREAETSEINSYLDAQPQLTSDAPLNESQSNELRKERSQQPSPSNSQNENCLDLRRSTRTHKPPDRFGVYITY